MGTDSPPKARRIGPISLLCSHRNCRGKGTYDLPVLCTNCGLSGTARFTRGHEATREICPNCDTRNLRQYWGIVAQTEEV